MCTCEGQVRIFTHIYLILLQEDTYLNLWTLGKSYQDKAHVNQYVHQLMIQFKKRFFIDFTASKSTWLGPKLSRYCMDRVTVFPYIVSTETILFWIWISKGYSTYDKRSQYIDVRKLFKGGNYMKYRKYGTCLVASYISWNHLNT